MASMPTTSMNIAARCTNGFCEIVYQNNAKKTNVDVILTKTIEFRCFFFVYQFDISRQTKVNERCS